MSAVCRKLLIKTIQTKSDKFIQLHLQLEKLTIWNGSWLRKRQTLGDKWAYFNAAWIKYWNLHWTIHRSLLSILPVPMSKILGVNFKDIDACNQSSERERAAAWIMGWFMRLRLKIYWWGFVARCGKTYFVRVRVRLSSAALMVFCASTWVISSALASLMDTTQSPTPTPAWAAFPPGVSWAREDRN